MSQVIGIGRLCLDRYLVLSSNSDRFDGSSKIAAEEIAQAIGGSVPRILAAASASRSDLSTRLIAGANHIDHSMFIYELEKLGISCELFDTESSAYSYITLRKNNSLISVTSVDEGWELPSIDTLPYLSTVNQISDLLIDARHPSCAETFFSLIASQGKQSPTVWLDPGSTALSDVNRIERTIKSIEIANIVIANSEFFDEVSKIIGYNARKKSILAIETMATGSVHFTGTFGCGEVRSPKVKIRGSSLGAGDIFRGRLLAHLSGKDIMNIDKKGIEQAIFSSLAASAWRLEQESIVPDAPDSYTVPFNREVTIKNEVRF